jgi:hypothetical protein
MKLTIFAILACILALFGPVNLVADTGSKSGTVAEAIDAGGYTYLRIKESDTWIATSTMEVSEGTQIEYSGGSEMLNFHSKSLNRTFESIWFVGNVSVAGRDAERLQQGAGSHPSMHDTIPKSTAIASPAPGEIEKLKGGKTVKEVLSNPAALDTQTISLRARVTKVNADIMGRNWITLQDGTGTAPDNKIIATSQEMVTVGDTVTAKGVISNDVDLGSGYHYVALLEEATFAK